MSSCNVIGVYTLADVEMFQRGDDGKEELQTGQTKVPIRRFACGFVSRSVAWTKNELNGVIKET